MGMKLDASLARFRSNIQVTGGLRQQISERLRALQTEVQQHLGVTETILIGSFARGTLVPPAKDFDVMFVMPGPRPQPLEALHRIANVPSIQPRGPRVQRHSVGVQFVDFKVDVVPAYRTSSGYEIPELSDANNLSAPSRWIATDPRAHTDRVAEANRTTGGIAASIVATLKYINREKQIGLTSFHLEVMALDAMDAARRSGASFAQGLQYVLRALPERVRASTYDRGGANACIDSELREPRRTEVARHLARLADEFDEAAHTDDVERARRVIPGLP